MNKYLQELLKLSNTVIIPGLGALTITNDKTGELFFISYLKHDDGKLAEFIASKEEIELIDAKNNLAKYVREITALLDKGESFDIFNFGKFIKDGSGNIVFEQFTKNEHKLSEPTFSKVTKEKLETQLEKASETDSKKNQIIDSPSLDTILNKQIDESNYNKSFDEKIIEEESINTETIVQQETTPDKTEIIEKNELEEIPSAIDSIHLQSDIIEDEKEISSTKTTSIVDEINEIPDPEDLKITINHTNKESITTINEINNENITINSKVKADEKIEGSNIELKNTTEKEPEKNINETTTVSPKKKSFKKRFIGIIIPLIIASFAFLFPRFFNSSTKVKEESKVEEKTNENQDSSEKSKISSKNTPSKIEKVDETVETINTTPPPVTTSVTPTPATPIKKQFSQNKTTQKQLVTSSQAKSNLGVQIQIIAGSFKEKENALKFNELLIQKGYKNSSIIENNEFFQICIGSFDVLEDAKNFSRTIKLPKGYWFKFVK